MSEHNDIEGYMTDSLGRLVPLEVVGELDRLRDETVRGIITRSIAMRERLTAFKKEIRDELLAYIELSF